MSIQPYLSLCEEVLLECALQKFLMLAALRVSNLNCCVKHDHVASI
jgi:hypothetical protein